MVSKSIFIGSITLNILFVVFLITKRINAHSSNEPYFKARADLFNALPDDSGEIVFLGNSLVGGFPASEIFKNPKIKTRGVDGNETRHMLTRLNETLRSNPDKIFLLIGINDLRNGTSAREAIRNLESIVDSILARCDSKIYIQSLFPNEPVDVEQFNRQAKELAGRKKVTYMDFYSEFLKDGKLDSSLTYDGLHLNAKGYLRWAEMLKPYLEPGL